MKSSNFKTPLRLAICLLLIGAFVLFTHLHDLGDQYGAVDYFTLSLFGLSTHQPQEPKPVGSKGGDKVIVMAKMEHEDTSWVAEELPEYVYANWSQQSC
jgi:hypothetical protein